MSANEESASARDFGFLLFLTLLNVMNFVDRQLLASFGNWIKPDLQLSNTEFGILTGLAFLLFYSVGGLFMGALADKYNRTRLIAIGLAFWSILTALSGAARGFVSMLIPRMLIGVGESMMTPTAMSLLSDRFPARQLGFASGFYYMGVPVGVAASLFVVAYLEPLLGWRGCFYLLGGIGVFLALIIVVFLKEPKRKQIVETSTEETRVSFKEILFTLVNALKNSPALLMTIGGGVAFHFILGAATFEQLWFVEERGFDRSEIAEITGWTRYRIEGDVTQDATIQVIDRGGIASGIASRTDTDPSLRGGKHRAAFEKEITVGLGSDGRSVIHVPEVKDSQTTGLTLLHCRFHDRLDTPAIRAVMQGYRGRYGALKDAVTESHPSFRDDILSTIDVVELLTSPVYVLAEHWTA